jgi:AAA family ATP:ADP antiporter
MTEPESSEGTTTRKSALESFLGLFAEVRPGEGTNVVLMFANIFLILTAYYVLKVVREGLTIGGIDLFGLGGDEIKAYLPAVMTVLLLGVVPFYGWIASTVSRVKLLNLTTLFVMVTLVLFWMWGSAVGIGTAIGLSFYVYLGIVNVFLIAQFWSFANDIYTEREGKRLFAIIAIGQSLGAVVGPQIAGYGARHIFALLLVSAGIFAVCLIIYNVVNRRESRAAADPRSEHGAVAEEPLRKDGGFQLVFQTRYLLLIACMILVTNVINTNGEYILANAAKTHSEQEVPSLTG